MAEFKVQIKCMWNSETCQFEKFVGEEQSMEDNEEDEEDDDDAAWEISELLLHHVVQPQQHKDIDAADLHLQHSAASGLGHFFSCPRFSQNLNLSWSCPPHCILNGPCRLSVNHNIWHIFFLTCFALWNCKTRIKIFKEKHYFALKKKLVVFLFLHNCSKQYRLIYNIYM